MAIRLRRRSLNDADTSINHSRPGSNGAGAGRGMSIAALIRRMAEAGATAEVIAMAVETIETRDAQIAERRAKAAERKRRQRERERDSHATVTGQSVDSHSPVTGQSRDTPSPLVPPSPLSPTPPISTPPLIPPTPRHAPQAHRSVKQADHPDFPRFWAEYPSRGDASNPRKPAAEKFARAVANGADPDAIIAGAKAYAASCHRQGITRTERVAQAVTWINQARWLDYGPAPPSGTSAAATMAPQQPNGPRMPGKILGLSS